MSSVAFVLVFISVFLHVGWNFLSKKNRPSMVFYVLMSGTAAMMWLPFFVLSDFKLAELPPVFWGLFLGSVGGEIIYMFSLYRAYKHGDISFVYPIVRALPVLMIAVITVIFHIGENPGWPALCGMGLITVGCMAMPFATFREIDWRKYCNKTIYFILLGALGTTAYTLFDSEIMKIFRAISADTGADIKNTLGLLFMIESGLTCGEVIFVLCSRRERVRFGKVAGNFQPYISGVFSSCAYGLILFAMNYVSNVSYIQAFRQISLPLGFLAGIFLLKEKVTYPKLCGMILIVLGLVLCKIS